jgi:hypothetical protein
MMIAKVRLFLTVARDALVAEGDPAAAFSRRAGRRNPG